MVGQATLVVGGGRSLQQEVVGAAEEAAVTIILHCLQVMLLHSVLHGLLALMAIMAPRSGWVPSSALLHNTARMRRIQSIALPVLIAPSALSYSLMPSLARLVATAQLAPKLLSHALRGPSALHLLDRVPQLPLGPFVP